MADAVTLALLASVGLRCGDHAAAQTPAPFDMNAPSAVPSPEPPTFTAEELHKVLAPYALHPDDLLAQVSDLQDFAGFTQGRVRYDIPLASRI